VGDEDVMIANMKAQTVSKGTDKTTLLKVQISQVSHN